MIRESGLDGRCGCWLRCVTRSLRNATGKVQNELLLLITTKIRDVRVRHYLAIAHSDSIV